MKLTNVSKTYHNKHNDVEALKGITLEVNNTGITVLLGSSGCGKSTLLNILSGQDKDFEGTLEISEKLDYITQDFRLFEAMSVEENLQIISSNQEQIDYYLDLFEMGEHRTKRVKKCSNGQKKRVQFIRAMLQAPSLLLCDEPTSALDHENSELLMEQLKKISKDVQVFLVTHDIALAEKYADHILTMDNGRIIKDQSIHATKPSLNSNKTSKQSSSKTVKTILTKFKSRPFEAILMVVFAMFLSLSLYVTTQIFTNVNDQTQAQIVWDKGFNMVSSKVKAENIGDNNLGGLYQKNAFAFDVFTDTNIDKALRQIEDIVAVEAFYDVDRYADINHTNANSDWQIKSFQTGETYFSRGKDTYFKQPKYFPLLLNKELLHAEMKDYYDYLVESDEKDIEMGAPSKYHIRWIFYDKNNEMEIKSFNSFIEMSQDEREAYIFTAVQSKYFSNYELVAPITIHPYELVNNYQLPLILGAMPQSTNEVVLDYSTAQLVKQRYDFDTLETMIGQEIELAIPIDELYYTEYEIYKFAFPTMKIAGITSYKSEAQSQIFFLQGGVKATLLKGLVNPGANVSYTELSFLLNPKADFPKVSKQLNEIVPLDNNQLVLYSDILLEENKDMKAYMKPSRFAIFTFIMMVSILLVVVVYYLLIHPRFKKEQMILSIYGYSITKESVMRLGILYLVATLLLLIILPILIPQANELARKYLYDSLLNFNFMFLMGSILSIYLIHLILDMVFGKILQK